MKETSQAFALLLLLGASANAPAAIHFYGREPVSSSGWTPGLKEIVNHPARANGFIGPLAPSGRFHYVGDDAVLNEILEKYALVRDQPRTVYVEAGPGNNDDRDFDLSITHSGHGFLHVYAGSRIKLEDIKIPLGVNAEVFPGAGEPIDPREKERFRTEVKRIEEFIDRWKAERNRSSQLPVGTEAPEIAAVTMDGNAINAFAPWPSHFAGKTVLIAFWSLTNANTSAEVEKLKALRKEFGPVKFQMMSVCIDDDWEPWRKFIEIQASVDYGNGRVHFGSDSVWWQAIRNLDASNPLAAWQVQTLPAYFLVGPNRRLLAAPISGEKLQETLAAALKEKTK